MKLVIVILASLVTTLVAAQQPVDPTSATDHDVRIHNTKRVKVSSRAEQKGRALKKNREGSPAVASKEAKVYKKHRHFATRDIKIRSRSRYARKQALGLGQ